MTHVERQWVTLGRTGASFTCETGQRETEATEKHQTDWDPCNISNKKHFALVDAKTLYLFRKFLLCQLWFPGWWAEILDRFFMFDWVFLFAQPSVSSLIRQIEAPSSDSVVVSPTPPNIVRNTDIESRNDVHLQAPPANLAPRSVARPPILDVGKRCVRCNISRRIGKYCPSCGDNMIDDADLSKLKTERQPASVVSDSSTANGRRFQALGGKPVKCRRCSLSVFFAERASAAGYVFHKKCLRCKSCKASLTSKMNDRDGEI